MRTVTARSQAIPSAMLEAGTSRGPGSLTPWPTYHWDTRGKRVTRPRRRQLLKLSPPAGPAWKSFCSWQPEAAQLIPFEGGFRKGTSSDQSVLTIKFPPACWTEATEYPHLQYSLRGAGGQCPLPWIKISKRSTVPFLS